jgi:hypothetical protein
MKKPTPSRPKVKTEQIDESRLTEELSGQIDAWIAAQPEPRPTRSEAIRRLLSETLGTRPTPAPFGRKPGRE